MVTESQKELVQESFAAIAPVADGVAALFYTRLFEIAPELEAMFTGDMVEQRRKFMQMLAAAVKGLDHLDQLVPVVQDLGRRHGAYGVGDKLYDTLGEALLWTLEQGFGPTFTPQMKEAWTAVYALLATTMKDASHRDVAAIY